MACKYHQRCAGLKCDLETEALNYSVNKHYGYEITLKLGAIMIYKISLFWSSYLQVEKIKKKSEWIISKIYQLSL